MMWCIVIFESESRTCAGECAEICEPDTAGFLGVYDFDVYFFDGKIKEMIDWVEFEEGAD